MTAPPTGPGGVPLTREQAEAIGERQGSLLVAANAGSGKTSVIVERFVRAVRDDDVPVTAILAITFTEKAAAGLRERVRKRFLELDEEERARETENAWISTIHAFCARLLRAHPLGAGLDPRFTVLDETAADRAARRAFDEALEAVLDAGGDGALDDLAPWTVAQLRDMVVFAHDRLRTRGQTEPDLPPAAPRDLGAAVVELRAATEDFTGQLGAASAASEQAALETLRDCREWIHGLAGAEPDIVPDDIKAPPKRTAALKGAAATRFATALETARGACFDRAAQRHYERVRELLRAYRDRYAAAKQARSALDFADLELHALELLAGDTGLRERYASRFTHVMVDEFQDVNPVQARLIAMLSRDNLFAVGDAFQSIYRFRHADVEVFETRRRELGAEGRVRALAANFRSRPELLASLNVAWAGALFEAGFTPLEPGREEPADTPPVEVLVTFKEGWDEVDLGATLPRASAWRMAEARLLAERVQRLVRDEGRSPRDIVVLTRATGHMGLYERALEEAGVPTYLIGGRGFWANRQVQDVAAYLALLANPRDDLRLYEALASPLAGVSADTLVLLADAARGPAWDALNAGVPEGVEPADRERLKGFAERLTEHRTVAPRLALDSLVERIVADTGYDLAVLRMPGARRRAANLRKLMRLAREYEATEGRDVRGLADHLTDLAGDERAERREGEAPVEGEALDAVRLMTIHRAKGLEFPVVCLADLGREPMSAGREHLRIGPKGEIGLRVPENGNGSRKAFAWQTIGEAEAAADRAEERRLHYVGMTRAEDLLIVSGAIEERQWADGSGREALAWIAPALAPGIAGALTRESPRATFEAVRDGWWARVACTLNTPEGDVLPGPARTPAAAAEPSAAPAVANGRATPPAAPVAAPAPRVPVDRLSYSSLQEYARCPYRFYLRRVLGLPEAAPADDAPAQEEGLPPTVRGSLVHSLLEALDFTAPAPPDPAAVAAFAAAQDVSLHDTQARDVAGLVAAFAESDLCARLARADAVAREEGLTFVLPAPGGDPVLVTGFVDVIAAEGSKRLVVDYKTDSIDLATAEAHVDREYGGQRIVYALAALRGGATAVEVVHCFLEPPGATVTRRYEAADAPALEAELASLASGVLGGDFPVTEQPHRWLCRTCPGQRALCSWEPEMTLRDPPESR
jgi:ATP-dependent helicase/nuclease subunit A